MKSSINKPFEYEEYYQRLGNDKDNNYFENMKDVLVLAAVMGFIRNDPLPFSKAGGEAIKEHIFQDDLNIFDIIAILSTGDIKILLNEQRENKYKLVEEYAHGGIKYLVENIFNGEITSFDNIVEFTLKFAPYNHEAPQNIGDFIKDLVHELES